MLLVDDHPMVREGLQSMLVTDCGIEIVGEASTGEEAVRKAHELGPQVVLMDIRMPDMSGTEATRIISKQCPETSVIIVTMYDSPLYVSEAIRCGAVGFLTKDTSRGLLCHAVRAAVEGGTLVSSGLLRQAMRGLPQKQRGSDEEQTAPGLREPLTAREREVLQLLTEGFANKQIARKLGLAEVTVKKHVHSTIAKLGASDRTHAAMVALRLGLVV